MKFTLTFACDGVAFDGDDLREEIGDILRSVEVMVKDGQDAGDVHDVNGNNIGSFSLVA